MIDERTGRRIGDHGTAKQALDFALDVMADDPHLQLDFLEAWRKGDGVEGCADYYAWLAEQEAPPAEAPGIGRTELTGGEDA
jgi:hypothetical protein